MVQDCIFCNKEYENYTVKKYDHWDLQLFGDSQYFIGRSVIVFRDAHIEDICDATDAALLELLNHIIPDLKGALESLFSPDLYNYASLGNDARHLHIHVIPRYKTPVQFDKRTFEDEFWNRDYALNDNQRMLNEETMTYLQWEIKNNL